jgi:hypothetical protein
MLLHAARIDIDELQLFLNGNFFVGCANPK